MSCQECFYITGHGDECSVGGAELRGENKELEERLKRYQDFVHELAAREHGQFCDSQYGLSCDCIVGEAAAVIMDSPRGATQAPRPADGQRNEEKSR